MIKLEPYILRYVNTANFEILKEILLNYKSLQIGSKQFFEILIFALY